MQRVRSYCFFFHPDINTYSVEDQRIYLFSCKSICGSLAVKPRESRVLGLSSEVETRSPPLGCEKKSLNPFGETWYLWPTVFNVVILEAEVYQSSLAGLIHNAHHQPVGETWCKASQSLCMLLHHLKRNLLKSNFFLRKSWKALNVYPVKKWIEQQQKDINPFSGIGQVTTSPSFLLIFQHSYLVWSLEKQVNLKYGLALKTAPRWGSNFWRWSKGMWSWKHLRSPYQ